MSWLTRKLARFFELDMFDYERVIIKRQVIDEIIALAKENAPKEFIALFEGKVDKKTKTLKITGLYYQVYYASDESAWMKINLPTPSKVFGSVHSHPGPRNTPSSADLFFFSKHGTFHMIISSPYTEKSIACFNNRGEKTGYTIE